MKKSYVILLSTILVAPLAACTSSGGGGGGGTPQAGGGGALPIMAKGKMLALQLPSKNKVEQNSFLKVDEFSAVIDGVTPTDRTTKGGVGFSAEGKKDPDGTTFLPDTISAKLDTSLAGGTKVVEIKDAPGRVYFDSGNFGDVQVTDAKGRVSSVGVYNIYKNNVLQETIVLKEATSIRFTSGNAGDSDATFGVGFAGNETASMPTSGKATYKAFWEGGASASSDGGTIKRFAIGGDAELIADFTTATVTGGVTNLKMWDAGKEVVAPVQKGIEINATIAGAEYAGTAAFVDGAGKTVGATTNSEVIGGFFGANASETVAVMTMEGNMDINGSNRDYVVLGTMGGVKK